MLAVSHQQVETDSRLVQPPNAQDIRPSVCMCRSGFEGVNNGMMAAAPGLPLWQSVVQILEDRAVPTGDKWKDAPIFQTGPNVLTTVWRSAGLRD